MSFFTSKKIAGPILLGERIKQAREEKEMSLDALSETANVSVKYLQFLEANHFEQLPKSRAFRMAYLNSCISALKLDYDQIIKQFAAEGGWKDIGDTEIRSDVNISGISVSVLVRNVLIALTVAFFIGYLIWQINGIVQPPILNVFSPLEGSVVNQQNVLIQGVTEKETRLTINGQEVRINEKGQFESIIDLSNGVNTITISATKKHGKTTTVTRHVVVKLPTKF